MQDGAPVTYPAPVRKSLALALALATALAAPMLAAPTPAHAQRALDISRFTPAPDGDGFLGITGTRTPGPFNTNFGLYASYASQIFLLRSTTDPSARVGIVTDRVDLDAYFQVGLFGRFALVVDAPVVAYQQGNAPFYDGGGALPLVAIRDPRLAVRARLLGEDSTVERARHEGEGIALQFATTIPAGMSDAFAGEGAPTIEGAVLGDFHLLDFGIGGQIGVRHHFSEPQILGVPFRNQLYAGLAIQVPAFFIDHLVAIAEVDVTTDLENPFGNQTSTGAEWRLGGRYALGDTQITVAGGTGLVAGVGVPSGRLILGISFAPRVHDRDGDGITDDHDACITLPEDFDDHEDTDGCPEPDNDGDLVPDLDDRCPNEAADFDLDADEDGCNDAVVDADGDGVQDGDDACPTEAEDLDAFADEDGCAELDDDEDGVPDAQDHCRAVAEDRDGFADEDGCPELDDDEDGVPDASDACPRAAEDVDQHDDADGCPDPDDDHDGVLDASDRCPDQPETINGRADEDGCPDAGRGRWTASGVGTAEFALTGTLRFAADGTLPESEASALDQLALWLRVDAASDHAVLLPRADDARVSALRSALLARGVTNDGEVAADASLRGASVRVVRATPSAAGPAAPSDAPAADAAASP